MGYKKSNDRFVFEVLSKTPFNDITPKPDMRGKSRTVNYIERSDIQEHIMSFNPQIAHYRREHAPKRLYLPSDITINAMFNDYKDKHPNQGLSYNTYRLEVRKKGISFTKLGHEECESCESFKLHGHKSDSLVDGCSDCEAWKTHIESAKEARELYQEQCNSASENDVVFSADLQKIIMLPRVDTFKKVLFTKRLTTYHESYVPIGTKSGLKPFACIWHEGISGRNKEDLISTFYAFLKNYRDAKNITIWLDNCSSQNKNWCLYSFLVYVINSCEINASTITLNYFEAGHTFMAADSFHHSVELSLKKRGKVYDFQDFVDAVKSSRKKVDVKVMDHTDFYLWKDYTSHTKLIKDPERLYMADIVQVVASRGKRTISCKTSFKSNNCKELDFLMQKAIKKGMPAPEHAAQPCGFPKEKRDKILKDLGQVIPENRKLFWKNMFTCD